MKLVIALLSVVLLSIFSSRLIATEIVAEKGTQDIAVLKSAVVFNIMKFTRWSKQSLSEGDKLRLGLAGDDAVVEVIKSMLANKRVLGHELEIVSLPLQDNSQKLKETGFSGGNFHMIYVADNVSFKKVMQEFATPETLLVGGTEPFAEVGGMVSVVYKPSLSRVVVEVNLEALAGKSVSLSSKLLTLATIVGNSKIPLRVNIIPELPILRFTMIDQSWA